MIMCNYRNVFFLSCYATFLCTHWNSSRQSANAEIFAEGNKVFFLFVSDRKMPKNKKKGGSGKERWRFGHFHLLQELKLIGSEYLFRFICMSPQISLLVFFFLSLSLLWNAGIASSCKHEYLCIATDSQSSSAFPTYQKLFLQGSLIEMEWNEIYSFFLFWTIMTLCFHIRMF